MSVKDGSSCPGCGLANYEGLCPYCRGDATAYEDELVPPFPPVADSGTLGAKLATNRTPRSIIEDPVDLGRFLEANEPPLALAQSEVEFIVGRPPSDPSTGAGFVSGFDGLCFYRYHDRLIYRRDDGWELEYRYEGALAYALNLATAPPDQRRVTDE